MVVRVGMAGSLGQHGPMMSQVSWHTPIGWILDFVPGNMSSRQQHVITDIINNIKYTCKLSPCPEPCHRSYTAVAMQWNHQGSALLTFSTRKSEWIVNKSSWIAFPLAYNNVRTSKNIWKHCWCNVTRHGLAHFWHRTKTGLCRTIPTLTGSEVFKRTSNLELLLCLTLEM